MIPTSHSLLKDAVLFFRYSVFPMVPILISWPLVTQMRRSPCPPPDLCAMSSGAQLTSYWTNLGWGEGGGRKLVQLKQLNSFFLGKVPALPWCLTRETPQLAQESWRGDARESRSALLGSSWLFDQLIAYHTLRYTSLAFFPVRTVIFNIFPAVDFPEKWWTSSTNANQCQTSISLRWLPGINLPVPQVDVGRAKWQTVSIICLQIKNCLFFSMRRLPVGRKQAHPCPVTSQKPYKRLDMHSSITQPLDSAPGTPLNSGNSSYFIKVNISPLGAMK